MARSNLPFERLRETFERGELRCRECGFEDREGEWRVMTDGSRVTYQHVCPLCEAVQTRELRL